MYNSRSVHSVHPIPSYGRSRNKLLFSVYLILRVSTRRMLYWENGLSKCYRPVDLHSPKVKKTDIDITAKTEPCHGICHRSGTPGHLTCSGLSWSGSVQFSWWSGHARVRGSAPWRARMWLSFSDRVSIAKLYFSRSTVNLLSLAVPFWALRLRKSAQHKELQESVSYR